MCSDFHYFCFSYVIWNRCIRDARSHPGSVATQIGADSVSCQNYYDTLYWHSLSRHHLKSFDSTRIFRPPPSGAWHMQFWVKYVDMYWMDCLEIFPETFMIPLDEYINFGDLKALTLDTSGIRQWGGSVFWENMHMRIINSDRQILRSYKGLHLNPKPFKDVEELASVTCHLADCT